MDTLTEKLSKVRTDIAPSKQSHVLREFDNLSAIEIKELVSTQFVKSVEAGIVIEYLGFPTLYHVRQPLLIFLQDMNWPAAQYVANLFISSGTATLPDIQSVLRSQVDPVWSYWLLTSVAAYWPLSTLQSLKNDLLLVISAADTEGAAVEALRLLKLIGNEMEYASRYDYLVMQFANNDYWQAELQSL